MSSKLSFAKHYWPIMFLMGGYISVALYLGVFLHYDFLKSDVLGYWQDSLAWQTPFHPFHVPGYPLAIAILRGITFGIPSAIGLMMSINLVTFLASAFLIYRIIQVSGASEELAALGVFLFGLWPFVGLTYAVNPVADKPAMFLFLTGLYFLLISRRMPAALFFGFSMITHKAMWIFIGLLVIAERVYRKEHVSKHNILFFVVMLLPLGVLWSLGSIHHDSITWLLSSNLDVEFASQSNLPILDGLLGTYMEGGIMRIIKGGLLGGFACVSAIAMYASLRLRYENFQYGLAISLTVFILFLILNPHEIWVTMRFGMLLVIPLILIANTYSRFKNIAWWKSSAIATALVILFLSQFVYSWYMAVIYFG